MGRTRDSMCRGGMVIKNWRAERNSGLGGQTGLAYLSPSVKPFLDAAGRLDQGGSHVFYTAVQRREQIV